MAAPIAMTKELVKMKEELKKPDELNKTPNEDDKDVDQQIPGIQTRYHCKSCEGKFGTWISSACGHLMCEKCIRHPKCVCDEDIKDRASLVNTQAEVHVTYNSFFRHPCPRADVHATELYSKRSIGKMVQPTVLRKRHSLKGLKLLPVIKKVRGGRPEGLKEFARMSKEKKTDVLELEEIENIVNSLTGENMIELLELAGRDIDVNEARWLLHCLIIFANEVGQPRGQALDDSTDPSTSASTGGSSTTVPLETAGPSKKGSMMLIQPWRRGFCLWRKRQRGRWSRSLKRR